MASYVERTNYAAAALLGRRILEMDPCNEEVHQQLMSCYARSGQRHLALAQYQRLADVLWHTFRVRPSDQATRLYQRLSRPQRVERFA